MLRQVGGSCAGIHHLAFVRVNALRVSQVWHVWRCARTLCHCHFLVPRRLWVRLSPQPIRPLCWPYWHGSLCSSRLWCPQSLWALCRPHRRTQHGYRASRHESNDDGRSDRALRDGAVWRHASSSRCGPVALMTVCDGHGYGCGACSSWGRRWQCLCSIR